MSKRRSRFEMHVDLLTSIKNGCKKPTRIMYRTNTSWVTLHIMLKSLISNGLVIECDSRAKIISHTGRTMKQDKRTKKTYELTEKGENILNYFRGINELIGIGHIAEITH